ncbi:FHA domain-containing protein [Actinoallomurus sp. CA-142502]|uniref:FHA domain-containing protein n=1 Tax=Actinoallomurus sp. CA-142502 TaxID=3239885 RepID=UPI003D9420F5
MALKGHAVGAVRMAHTWHRAETGDDPRFTLTDAGRSAAESAALRAVVGSAADGLVRDDPPPPWYEEIAPLLEEMVTMCRLPAGDAAGMEQLARAFERMADVVDTVTGHASTHATKITSGNAGADIEAFTKSFARLARGGGGHLPDAADACRGMAGFCRYMATEIKVGKAQFYLSGAYLFTLWAIARIFAPTPAGPFYLATATAKTRTAGMRLAAMLRTAEGRAAVSGARFVGGLNLVGQLTRMGYGLQDGLDLGDLAESGLLGAAGGGATGAVYRRLGEAAMDGNSLAKMLTGTLPGRLATHMGVNSTVFVANDIAANAIHNGGTVHWDEVNVGKDLLMSAGMGIHGEVMHALKGSDVGADLTAHVPPADHSAPPATGGGGPRPDAGSSPEGHGSGDMQLASAPHDSGDVPHAPPLVRDAGATGQSRPVYDRSGGPVVGGHVGEASAPVSRQYGPRDEPTPGRDRPGMPVKGTVDGSAKVGSRSPRPPLVARPESSAHADEGTRPANGGRTNEAVPSESRDREEPIGPTGRGEPVDQADRGNHLERSDDRDGTESRERGEPTDPVATTQPISIHESVPSPRTEHRAESYAPAGHPDTGAAPERPLRTKLSEDGLLVHIAALEARRAELAGSVRVADQAVLHHHDPDPEIAALDAAILRARQELGPSGDLALAIGGATEVLRIPPNGKVSLGRSRYDSPLPYDEYVSRVHATFSVDAAGVPWVRDMGSLNGTFVNERRLLDDENVRLREGDVVRLGLVTELEVKGVPVAREAGHLTPATDHDAHDGSAGHENGRGPVAPDPMVPASLEPGRNAESAGRRIAEQYGLTAVSGRDAAHFFHGLTEIVGPGENRPLGTGPLTDLAHEVIGRDASVVDLLNLHHDAVLLGHEPWRARDRDELVEILSSAHDRPVDDPFEGIGRRLARTVGMRGLSDAEARGLGIIQNHLTRGSPDMLASYRRLVEIAHAAGLGDARAHEAGFGERSDQDAVLRLVRLADGDSRVVRSGLEHLIEQVRGEAVRPIPEPVRMSAAAGGEDSARALADHYGLWYADHHTTRVIHDLTVLSDPAYDPARGPAHGSYPLRDLAHDVLGPDATVADLLALHRDALEMGFEPSYARSRAELTDLLTLARHDVPAFRLDQDRQAFRETQKVFLIPERDDHTVRIVSTLKRVEVPDPGAAERDLGLAARDGRLGAYAKESVDYGGPRPGDAALYALARGVSRDLAVRDMIELYKYAEEKSFPGLRGDHDGMLAALRRARGELGPDLLTARRIADSLGLGKDEPTVHAVAELNRAMDPGGERSLPRGVGFLDWLANRVRPGLSVPDLIAVYRHVDAEVRGQHADPLELVRALRRADGELHPASHVAEAPSALRALPRVPASPRFLRDDAAPVERWPLSGGSPPSGPIDHTAAANGNPSRLNDLLKWYRDEEESPQYWGDNGDYSGEQPRRLEVGWRLDRNALFRGDRRGPERIFEEGFAMQKGERGFASDPELICTSRLVDTAIEFANQFRRKGADRWVYVIDAPGGYDIGGGQDEVKFIGGIDRRYIVGALRIPGDLPIPGSVSYDGRVFFPGRPQDQAEWIQNPHYRPD